MRNQKAGAYKKQYKFDPLHIKRSNNPLCFRKQCPRHSINMKSNDMQTNKTVKTNRKVDVCIIFFFLFANHLRNMN